MAAVGFEPTRGENRVPASRQRRSNQGQIRDPSGLTTRRTTMTPFIRGLKSMATIMSSLREGREPVAPFGRYWNVPGRNGRD